MDINGNNYQAFLLDLLEGRLSVVEERKLNDFLKLHPEYVVDLPDIDLVSLEKPQLSYPLRDQLRKELPTKDTRISASNFDMFSIARMEGDLSSQQEEEHRYMVSVDERRRKEWSDWQKTRLVPEQISFPEKMKLRRNKAVKGRVIWLSVLSAAAILTLVLILLRMDPHVSVPELSVQSFEEELPAMEASPLVQEESELIQELPLVVVEKEPSLAVNKTDSKPKQESPKEMIDSGLLTTAELPAPRPLRMAGLLASNSEIITVSDPDKIEPLQIPTVSPNLNSLSMAQIAELDRQELFNEFTEEHNISLLSVANAGIKGINKLTGSDISLMASKDEEGEVSGFRLKSKRFSVTRPLARQE